MAYSEHVVSAEEAGIRLDRWFKRYFPQLSHVALQKALRKGQVRVNGKKCEASARLEQGASIRIWDALLGETTAPAAPKKRRIPEALQQQVLQWVIYKDASIIALNKPAGIAVQGGTNISKSVDAMLDALKGDSAERPKLVHRLDKDTSGVLLLGRTAKAAKELATLFAEREIDKTYLALVIGVPRPMQGVIDLPIAKGMEGMREKMGVDHAKGLRAVTEYTVIEPMAPRLAWVEMKPVTGRTHQLRVHMAAIGHPIYGDGKYGGEAAFIDGIDLPKRLHLHAKEIIIPKFHGKRIQLRAELPEHMKRSQHLLNS